ncbi:MAG: NAD(P)-dependent oxidoreductase [Pseudomonadota bacterium]
MPRREVAAEPAIALFPSDDAVMALPALGVAVCARVPIKRLFAPVFAARGLTLLNPDEVTDPAAITFALSFLPADDAFAPFKNLRLAASIGAGAEAIVRAKSLPADVPVVRMMDDDQADQMAAFALFHIVYWHRRFDDLLAAAKDGRWARDNAARSPREKTVGVLGYGVMGARIAAVAADLGYQVRAFTRTPRTGDPRLQFFHGPQRDAFLAKVDFLVVVLPTTPETAGFVDAACLAALPKGAVVIHLGRGGQVVEDDLVAALDAGHLAGASLDVFVTEPLPADHPLWRHPKILATPHTASQATDEAVATLVTDGLAALARGAAPPGLVDRAAGY